ncbi:16S rRNA (uracil(1498)-N(3))-methyltransferase [Synechococcus sp. UW140]|uniref:16S rRNA (uracil(1498)-N(3))-methyltransferase n=1 Tax=Synechococcus sp. UW140 TaxID=368503 RepID=UPI000E0E268D|nr:16S rRNA (uracil(1498)-N(3))-methyltransferase [Synechococcus sp. UW140]
MAELRRLLIRPERLQDSGSGIQLQTKESHYLRRVLRLRPGDALAVVDGQGHLWTARVVDGEHLELGQSQAHPCLSESSPCPRLGLAVVGVRRGMDDLMRMACELGIDCIQPLRSHWRTPQAEDRPDRWQVILEEAVEQSERLWMPRLLSTKAVADWWGEPDPAWARCYATTRKASLPRLSTWLEQRLITSDNPRPAEVWIAIGPEAGWTEAEQQQAGALGWTPVQMGCSILRTATAAVTATALMTSCRATAVELERSQSRSVEK